ncbi:MAG TPA: hypothetical protein VHC97_10475 [Thermoanaerobaculia bacterium]|jgi:hypothetical protein|nr:hypothetical protein [Thermoanaerobaculia bacterium]
MKRNEYEQRKRILDEQLRMALDLVHAGHRAQVQMLEMLWRTSGGEAAEASEAPSLPVPPEAPLPSSPPTKQRRNAHELYFEVVEALPQLPEDFTKNDVLRCLGHSPDRASLFRVLATLRDEGAIELRSEGSGKKPAVYHKKQEERS